MSQKGRNCVCIRHSLVKSSPRPQVSQLPTLFYRTKSSQKLPPMKTITPVNSRFSAEQKLTSLLKDLNVDLRKMNFSLNYYLQKLDDAEVQLRELISVSCFVFLLGDLGCDLRNEQDYADELVRRERNHFAPRDKMRAIRQGVEEHRIYFMELTPRLCYLEDQIISVEDYCASLNYESMSLLGSLGVVCGF